MSCKSPENKFVRIMLRSCILHNNSPSHQTLVKTFQNETNIALNTKNVLTFSADLLKCQTLLPKSTKIWLSKALSKCSNYPNSIREILAMSQNSIHEILAMSSKKYFQLINFLSNISSIHEKIQTPWTIQFYVVKNTSMKTFLWSKKHKFLNLAMFSKKHSQNFSDTIWIVLGLYFFHGFYLDSIMGHKKMKSG